MSAHKEDFHAWCFDQANLIRENKIEDLDLENIAEEIESLGKSEESELQNRLSLLISHLLKWKYQPERRSKSWMFTIKEQRKKIKKHLFKHPSLNRNLNESFDDSYSDAVMRAEKETKLDIDIFPETMPFSQEDVLKDGWLAE
jgi:hypothetical protein